MLSPQRCHCNVVTATLSPQRCHRNACPAPEGRLGVSSQAHTTAASPRSHGLVLRAQGSPQRYLCAPQLRGLSCQGDSPGGHRLSDCGEFINRLVVQIASRQLPPESPQPLQCC